MGCDVAEKTRVAVVEKHREQARGRVGVFRAMSLQESAVGIAERINRQGDARCAGPEDRPFEATIQIEAEILSPKGEVIDRFVETRRVARDASGNLSVRFETAFVDPSGRRGTATREERIVGQSWYVREQNLPFIARRGHRGDVARLQRRAMDAIPALLAAGGSGWLQGKGGAWTAVEKAGGEQFQCGLTDAEQSWLRRLSEVSEWGYGEAELPPRGETSHGRSVVVRMQTGPEGKPRTVRLDAEEKVVYRSPPPVTAPETTTEARRDRPYHDIQRILGGKLGFEDWKRR